jgi:hypothetical protein
MPDVHNGGAQWGALRGLGGKIIIGRIANFAGRQTIEVKYSLAAGEDRPCLALSAVH